MTWFWGRVLALPEPLVGWLLIHQLGALVLAGNLAPHVQPYQRQRLSLHFKLEGYKMSQMTEIRWHGRAGQGVVTAGELLAESAMVEGKYFQAFPEYGSERMGAPIKAYTRVSDEPIELHCPILEPDIVIVVNDNLLGIVDLTEGLKPNGKLIINTTETPARIRERLNYRGGEVWCVDASQIAMQELKRDIPSTMILAVISKASGLVQLDAVTKLVRESLGNKLRPEVVEANMRALKRAYDECSQG